MPDIGFNKLHPGNNQDLEMYGDTFQSVTSKIIFFEAREAKYSAIAGIWTRLVFNLNIQKTTGTGR